jgi:hypothetical protein
VRPVSPCVEPDKQATDDDGREQAVPVCPVCGKLETKQDAVGGVFYSCDCLDGPEVRHWRREARWWQHVAKHTRCTDCDGLPTLIDGLAHHACPVTDKRWRKEPREWYARHHGAGEQATDETT